MCLSVCCSLSTCQQCQPGSSCVCQFAAACPHVSTVGPVLHVHVSVRLLQPVHTSALSAPGQVCDWALMCGQAAANWRIHEHEEPGRGLKVLKEDDWHKHQGSAVSVCVNRLTVPGNSPPLLFHYTGEKRDTTLSFVLWRVGCWGGGGGQNGCVQEWVLLCQVFKERKWLGHVSYASGHMQYSVPRVSPKAPLPQSFQVSQSFQVTLVYCSSPFR